MKQLVLQSANFKRDYVATTAVVLFLLIVVSEIALAVAIPAYLYRESSMALEVRRLTLLQSFDNVRRRCQRIKTKSSSAAEMELYLVSWNLNLLANYMRSEQKKLTSDEIARLQKAVDDSNHVLNILASGKSISREASLNTGIYVNSLIPKENRKQNVRKKAQP